MRRRSIIAIFILSIILLFSSTVLAESEAFDGRYIKGRFYLDAFGIDTAEFDENSKVSRGFVANVISNALFDDLVISPVMTSFQDVYPDTPYASAIYLLSNYGIMQGDGVKFSPDENVTYGQVAKIFMSALGWDIVANEKGGYPHGYIAIANTNGIFDGVNMSIDDEVSFCEFARMYYNFLFCNGLVRNGVNFSSYTIDTVSALEQKLTRCDMKYIEGIVTGNQFGSAINDVVGEILIDGSSYNLACEVEENLVGYRINAFVKQINGRYTVTAIIKDPVLNDVKRIEASDIDSIALDKISYWENEREHRISLSELLVVRNGKILSQYTEADLKPLNGGIVLIDNDNDGEYECIHVENKQYYTVDRISAENNVIILKDGNYEGSTHLYVNPLDTEYYHRIYKSNGEVASFEDIKEDMLVRLEGCKEQKILCVYIIDEIFDGSIEMLNPNDVLPLTINGKKYGVAKAKDNSDLVDFNTLSFNKVYAFAVDGEFIIKAKEKDSDGFTYAYVIDFKSKTSLSTQISYMLVSEDKQVYIGELAEQILYNGTRVYLDEFTPRSGVVIEYKIDQDGKICAINDAEIYSEKAKKIYKKENGILYSQTYEYPLFMSKDTVVFIVPDSGETDDFMADISLVNGYTYNCEAYDYNEEDSSVSVLVIYDDVKYETQGYISAESPICIVKQILGILDEEGKPATQLIWLEGTEEKSALIKDTAFMKNTISKMAIGDVFQYSLTSRGYIDNINTLIRLDQNPAYFHQGIYSSLEEVYGKVINAEQKVLPKGYVAEFVNIFSIDTNDGSVKNFLVTSEDEAVNYYIYNSSSNQVRVASFDDVLSEDGVLGTFTAAEIYIYYYGQPVEAKAVVLKN